VTERPPRRPRRVQLSTPGSSEKMMQKASESKADHVFLDLEDAVAPSQKREARKKIIQALKTLNWTGKTRCVRINDLTTEYAYEDIIEIVEGAGDHLDTIMMTKVQTAADVLFADKLLHQIEKKLKMKRSIGLEALIEEVEGMQNVDEECRRSMILGCVGKWAIHPSQIEPALEIYSPKADDIARARKLEKAYAEAEAAGLGAISVDGTMVDVASIRILRNTILNKADLYKM
jgi:citrate lyase beta subunit